MSFPFSVFRFPFSVFRFPFSVFRLSRINLVKVAGGVVRSMYYGLFKLVGCAYRAGCSPHCIRGYGY
ncbi:hypothetical protein BWI97_16520 [Siphonobacter sp. BAB-5405]|nr:hypothetical protein BWI97_16520 [Siphonobacter sp. BAB-5405]